jgi:hypothetical protein
LPAHAGSPVEGIRNQRLGVDAWRVGLTCLCGSVHFWAMLSPGDRAIIKAEIERLLKARKECRDDGIREMIETWIVDQEQKLASSDDPACPVCGKPCPPEDCVTNPDGRTMHKACYRASRISTHH